MDDTTNHRGTNPSIAAHDHDMPNVVRTMRLLNTILYLPPCIKMDIFRQLHYIEVADMCVCTTKTNAITATPTIAMPISIMMAALHTTPTLITESMIDHPQMFGIVEKANIIKNASIVF